MTDPELNPMEQRRGIIRGRNNALGLLLAALAVLFFAVTIVKRIG